MLRCLLSLDQVFSILNYVIVESNELLVSMIIDAALGWLFASLGIYSTIKNIFVGISPKHPVLLDNHPINNINALNYSIFKKTAV